MCTAHTRWTFREQLSGMFSPAAAMWDAGTELTLRDKCLYHLTNLKIKPKISQCGAGSRVSFGCALLSSNILPITLFGLQNIARLSQTGPSPPRPPNHSDHSVTLLQSYAHCSSSLSSFMNVFVTVICNATISSHGDISHPPFGTQMFPDRENFSGLIWTLTCSSLLLTSSSTIHLQRILTQLSPLSYHTHLFLPVSGCLIQVGLSFLALTSYMLGWKILATKPGLM